MPQAVGRWPGPCDLRLAGDAALRVAYSPGASSLQAREMLKCQGTQDVTDAAGHVETRVARILSLANLERACIKVNDMREQ